jgi:hypothetical protein
LCHAVGGNVLISSVVDPEAEHTAALRGNFEDTDEPTTDRGWGCFRDVNGNSQRRGSDAQASYESARVDHIEVSVCSGHKRTTEKKNECRDDDRETPTIFFREREGEECTEETSGL